MGEEEKKEVGLFSVVGGAEGCGMVRGKLTKKQQEQLRKFGFYEMNTKPTHSKKCFICKRVYREMDGIDLEEIFDGVDSCLNCLKKECERVAEW